MPFDSNSTCFVDQAKTASRDQVDSHRKLDYKKLQPINAAEIIQKPKEFAHNTLTAEKLKSLDEERPSNRGSVQNEIQKLVKLMEKDQVDKEMGNILKTTFLSCNYSEEGFAKASEFEEKIRATHLVMAPKTLSTLMA
jgi:hypothetical protein